MSSPPLNNPHDTNHWKGVQKLSQEYRCFIGIHEYGEWNQDRHPRSLERATAHCPLIHWPFVYRVCELCGKVLWGHQPK